MAVTHRETVEAQGVEAVLLEVGEGHVELLRPLGPDTPVGKFLERKGKGLHHVAYSVEDIDATLERVGALGFELIDAAPRPGIGGTRVAFIHPRSLGGVLTEIVEEWCRRDAGRELGTVFANARRLVLNDSLACAQLFLLSLPNRLLSFRKRRASPI